jgi:hypothetical protein
MGYFKDDNGAKSLARLKVFIALISAVVLSFLLVILEAYFCKISTVAEPKDFQESPGVSIILGLLSYAGAVKVLQKREERKNIGESETA